MQAERLRGAIIVVDGMVPRLLAALLFPLALLLAHHSLAAEFDTSKPIVLRGKVTKMTWMNPHVHFWMDAAGADGKVTNWELESAAPNFLQRQGWTKYSVKAGDSITVWAFVAKDQANLAKTDAVTLPGGRRVPTGVSVERAPSR